MVEALV